MKFNFQKVSAVLTSVALMGSTAGIAAAASYPAPFVENGALGAGGAAVVWGGSGAADTDRTAAATIQSDLADSITSTAGATITGGDSIRIEQGSNLFNLGDDFTDFFGGTIDEDQLTHVLAEGTYENDDGDEFDYDQQITFGSTLTLEHFQDDDSPTGEKPAIGFNFDNNNFIFNYTLDFTDAVDADSSTSGYDLNLLETTDLPLLGRTYYVLDARSSDYQLTLLDDAASALLEQGETATIGGHEVTAKIIGDDNVILIVNGQQTKALSEGETLKLPGTELYIAIKDIVSVGKESVSNVVDVSIGTGKLVLLNGQEVELNNEDVDGVIAYITNSSDNLESIVISWTLDEDAWIVPGSDLVLPGFGTVKISMGGFNTEAKETTRIEDDSSDSVKLSTIVEDGSVNFNLLYTNETSGFQGLGKDDDKQLATKAAGASPTSINIVVDEDIHEWIVFSWKTSTDAESYVFKVGDVTGASGDSNETVFKSEASGSKKELKFTLRPGESSDSETLGSMLVTVNRLDKAEDTINLTLSTSSGNVYLDRLFTKDGLQIRLPVDDVAATAGAIGTGEGVLNITSDPKSLVLNATEEDRDENIAAGSSFRINLSVNSDDEIAANIFSADYDGGLLEQEEDSDFSEGYVRSALATKVVSEDRTDNPDRVTIEYHGDEAFADVFVSESMVTIGGPESKGVMIVSDDETSAYSDKNVIVVGGSCINTAAAGLVDGALCGSAFTQATGVGSGQYIIRSYESPWSTGKIALLVAGYEAADTVAAANYLVNVGVDTAVGQSKIGTSTTSTTA